MTKMEQVEYLKQKLCGMVGVASVDIIHHHRENLTLHHREVIVTGYQTISLPKVSAMVLNNHGRHLKIIWYVKYLDSQCRCGRPDNMHTGDKVIHWN